MVGRKHAAENKPLMRQSALERGSQLRKQDQKDVQGCVPLRSDAGLTLGFIALADLRDRKNKQTRGRTQQVFRSGRPWVPLFMIPAPNKLFAAASGEHATISWHADSRPTRRSPTITEGIL